MTTLASHQTTIRLGHSIRDIDFDREPSLLRHATAYRIHAT
jgi:hypothetical protein